MTRTSVFCWLFASLIFSAVPAHAQPIKAVRLGTTVFNRPVLVTAPPNDTTRLFVLEQPGTIKIVNPATGVPNATPFLTVPNVEYAGETGLLGLTFHPNYASNGFFYIYYTRTTAGGRGRVIARYHVNPATPDVADPASATIIWYYALPNANHNGGYIDFGPDGNLYIAWGNRGDSTNSPLLTNPLGKILRIDVNGPDGIPATADDDQFPEDANRNYCIPAGNPFTAPNTPEIWIYGLRNPWRDSFDRATGEYYIGDVGDSTWEEVDIVPPVAASAGRNYGYPCMEGLYCQGSLTSSTCACNNGTLTSPVYNYSSRGGTECAIQGGFVYRGCAMPWLNGLYFFGDYCSSKIWSGRWNGTTFTDVTERTTELWGPTLRPGILSFGQDARGELYICGSSGNGIYKIIPAAGDTGCAPTCGTSDFDGDGDYGTDFDIQAFFACLGGHCCPACFPGGADFNNDGDTGTDRDIESFFSVLGGSTCVY